MLSEIKVRHNTQSFIDEMSIAEWDIRDRSMARAINKLADQVKVQASREVRAAGYNLKAAEIKARISVRYATTTNLRATVTAKGRPIPLINYGARQTSKGVTVNVQRGRKLIAGAFIATMPSGHQGVFVREGNAMHRKDKRWHALPIRQLFGPSVPDGLANEQVQKALQQIIVDRFPSLLEHESAWLKRRATRQ